MTIAFDIDGTWTLNPNLFSLFAEMCEQTGWNVIIVTGSNQPKDKLENLYIVDRATHTMKYPFIVSGQDYKEAAALKAGYKVDIWVDDMPGVIQQTKILEDNL